MARGTVKRMVRDRGFGFIRDEQGGEFFFHRSACVASDAFDVMREDKTIVEFTEEANPKGPRATDIEIVAR